MHRLSAFFIGLLFFICAATGPLHAAEKTAEQVYVGAYINDIQQVDLQSHSYRMDIYVWFRWRDPAINPAATAEFMNAFDPSDHVRTALYEAPQKMPDGSLYMIIRDQGKFSTKFPLQRYPFDRQSLSVVIEDSVHAAGDLVYISDATGRAPATIGAQVHLPGFNMGVPVMTVAGFDYPTSFGDLRETASPSYSRVTVSVPVQRPWVATGIKVFLPVLLVIFCTALVFFVHPAYIEGRLGVAITALLTLVALQLTTASTLPEVDYLLMTDKVYLLSYLFIIVTMLQVVRTSGLVHAQKYDIIRAKDRWMLGACCLFFFASLGIVVVTTV